MTARQERDALRARAEELARQVTQMEARLAALPDRPEIAELRGAMAQLLAQARRSERNMRALLDENEESEAEEEHNHGGN